MDNTNKNPQPNSGRPPATPTAPATPAAPPAQGAAGAGQPGGPPQPPKNTAQPGSMPAGQQGGQARQPGQPGQGGAQDAKDAAKQIGSEAKQLASDTKHDVGSQFKSGVAAGKSRAVGALSGVAQSLETSAKQMRDQHQDGVSHYIDRAGQQVQRLADYLEHTDISDIADQTEDFARKQPAAFLGGAFVIGLIGARFLKSSRRQERHDQQRANPGMRTSSSASHDSSSQRSTPTYDRERSMPGSGSTGPADTARSGMTGGAMGAGGAMGTGASATGGASVASGTTGTGMGGTAGTSGQTGSSTGAPNSTGSERR